MSQNKQSKPNFSHPEKEHSTTRNNIVNWSSGLRVDNSNALKYFDEIRFSWYMLPFINCFFMWNIKNRLVFLLRVARSSEFFIGTKKSNIWSKWFWSNTYIWCYQLCSEQNLYYVLHLQVCIHLEHIYFESYTVFKNDFECEWFVIKKKPSKTVLIEQQEIYTLCLSN